MARFVRTRPERGLSLQVNPKNDVRNKSKTKKSAGQTWGTFYVIRFKALPLLFSYLMGGGEFKVIFPCESTSFKV